MAALFKRIGQLEAAPPWGFFAAVNTAFVPLVTLIAGTLISVSLLSSQLIAILLAWIIGAALTIAFVWVTRRTPQERAALRLDAGRSRLWIVLLFGLGVGILIDVIMLGITGAFLPEPELLGVYQERSNPLAWLLAIIFVILLQPVGEELVFRAVFFPVARQVIGGWGGLIVTTMVFALFHYIAYPHSAQGFTGVAYGLIAPLLAGLVFSGVRAYSGSTRAAIVAHIGLNLFALMKLLVL